MEKIEVKDRLHLSRDKQFTGILSANEVLFWSGDALKVNKANKAQNRDFAVTNLKFYNLGKKGNFLTSLFSSLVKRAIRLKAIQAITYSSISNYFVIHVPEEYDYYLCTPDRDEIILFILHAQNQLECPPLKLFVLQEVNLFKYSKTDSEPKDKWPAGTPKLATYSNFLQMMNEKKLELENNIKNTEVIMQMDGKDVNESSFEILKVLGKGFFGKVFLAEKKDTKQLYALKVISKFDIIKRNFFDNLKSEKLILETAQSPFVVKMECCFTSPSYVFFAMKFKQGGELYHHLRKMGRFSEDVARFYACQVLLGLEYLHSKSIMYRDMKPENILLDEEGNAALADFGISKRLEGGSSTKSFVGTPEYVAPEVILQKGYDKAIDIWCFGVLLFEMVYGNPPFFNRNQNLLLNMIIKTEVSFPKTIMVSEELQDLLSKAT